MAAAVLLIALLELGLHADSLSFWSDEVWSVFHSSRSIGQILHERDLLWPFGYFLTLHGWMQLTGTSNDFALHALGMFAGLVSVACLIRAGRELGSPLAGLLAGLAFGTSSYALYFSLELRGYSLMLALESGFICLYLRWLKRPSLRRSLPLLAVLIALLYIQFISGVVIAAATVYLLLWRPRLLARWGAIVCLAGLAFLPLLPQVWRGFQLASTAAGGGPLPAFFRNGLDSLFRAYSARWDLWFGVVLACAALGLPALIRRLSWQTPAWLTAWGVGIPLAAFLAREDFAFFTTRYLAFTLPAAILLLGLALGALPRPWIGFGLIGFLALAPWRPYDHRPSEADFPPLRDFMRTMAGQFRPGDRLVVDPSLAAQVGTMEWSYYRASYIPQGDFRLNEDGGDDIPGRRVWYLYRQGSEDPETNRLVRGGRVQRAGWGPWTLRAALLEAPPSDLGVPYDSALRFLGADVDRLRDVHAGDRLALSLWWAADLPAAAHIAVTLELVGPDGTVVEDYVDPLPPDGVQPASGRLDPGGLLLDLRQVRVPYHLDDGMYTLRLSLPGRTGAVDLDTFHLASFATW